MKEAKQTPTPRWLAGGSYAVVAGPAGIISPRSPKCNILIKIWGFSDLLRDRLSKPPRPPRPPQNRASVPVDGDLVEKEVQMD